MKTCSFLHAHFSESMQVVENLLRKAYGETLNNWKDKCCRYLTPTAYVSENKETVFKFTL